VSEVPSQRSRLRGPVSDTPSQRPRLRDPVSETPSQRPRLRDPVSETPSQRPRLRDPVSEAPSLRPGLCGRLCYADASVNVLPVLCCLSRVTSLSSSLPEIPLSDETNTSTVVAFATEE